MNNLFKDRLQKAPYNIFTAISAVILSLMAMMIPQLILGLINPNFQMIGGNFNVYIQYAVIVAVIILAVSLLLRRFRASDLGFKFCVKGESAIKTFARTLAVAAGMAVIFNLIYMLIVQIMPAAKTDAAAVAKGFGFGKNLTKDMVQYFGITVAAPFWEEIAYRSLAFRAFRDGLGIPKLNKYIPANILAVLLSSAVFASAHGGDGTSQFIPIFIMGAMFSITYLITGNILGPMLFHSFNNVYGGINIILGSGTILANGVSPYIVLVSPLIIIGMYFAMTWLYRLIGGKKALN